MATVERGCLVIADIAGYTKYLAGVELEHSQDVLADLINTVVSQMRGLMHLAKLEGDAVFCYVHDDDAREVVPEATGDLAGRLAHADAERGGGARGVLARTLPLSTYPAFPPSPMPSPRRFIPTCCWRARPSSG